MSEENSDVENRKVQIEVVKKEKSHKLKSMYHNFMKKKYAKPLIITLSILLLIVVAFSIFVCVNRFNLNVYDNVYIFGDNLAGYDSNKLVELLTSKNKDIELDIYQNLDKIYDIKSDEIEFKIDTEATVNSIMGFGRNSNVFVNNFNILKAHFKKVEIEPIYVYSSEKLDEAMKNIDLSIKNRYIEDAYSVDEENSNLIITKGKRGNAVDFDDLKQQVIACFKNTETSLKLNTFEKIPDTISAEQIYSKVKREPKDAYIDRNVNPIKFVKEEIGLDFSVEELEKELEKEENKEEGKVIVFPLIKKEPQVKLQDITYDMYNDKLAGYTTYFDASNYARGNNLSVALKYLNGKIIMPGEIFSYNDTVGDTTASKGYLPAAVFKAGTVENEIGGGICQTTSTLYNVALMANLEIVERYQHGLPVGYVPPSRDATVYIGVLDFKFKNTRNYPVKIVTSYSWNGTMNISLYGTREENEYEVSLSSQVISTIPYTTRYNYDPNMPEGQMIVISKGVNGYVSEGYITKKLNGTVVSSALLSRDTYKPQQEIVTYGTGNAPS